MFPAASTNRHYYTPETYPLDDLSVTVYRDGTEVEITDSVHDDSGNERYYFDSQASECVAGLYRFEWELTEGTETRTDVEWDICSVGEPVALLATPTDLVAFGYVDSSGNPVGWEKLARASQRVRRYSRQTVTLVEDDVVDVLPPYLLPQRPVRSISSVVDDSGNDVDYTQRGQHLEIDPEAGRVTVTYDHGFTNVPDSIAEVVCAIAYRMDEEKQAIHQGVQSEGAGGESVTYGMEAYVGATDLTREEKRVIDRYFPLVRGPRTVHIV